MKQIENKWTEGDWFVANEHLYEITKVDSHEVFTLVATYEPPGENPTDPDFQFLGTVVMETVIFTLAEADAIYVKRNVDAETLSANDFYNKYNRLPKNFLGEYDRPK